MEGAELFERYPIALWTQDTAARDKALEDVLASDFVAHDLRTIMPPGGLAELKRYRTIALQAFPDGQAILDELVHEGDKMAARLTLVATHLGPYRGMAPRWRTCRSRWSSSCAETETGWRSAGWSLTPKACLGG